MRPGLSSTKQTDLHSSVVVRCMAASETDSLISTDDVTLVKIIMFNIIMLFKTDFPKKKKKRKDKNNTFQGIVTHCS